MGDAKRKQAERPFLDGATRADMLGIDPFTAAYNLIYGMVEAVYTKTGGVNHELIGIDFKSGKPTGVHVVLIRRVEDVPALREKMLLMWPMVAHVCEAWAAPDASFPAHAHPNRQDVVMVSLNTVEFMASANCPVDEKMKTIQRASLFMPTAVWGRLGRSIAQRPLSS